ncbi:MAG: 30S ribosomal protein S17 [candidate division WS2 bacterium ADurb.Bin280]|uniref:Small ribosomal subunit protein uS17 n=1 Tax=candidate division WS2 bacterium ADurb.Bin280 TaxID=1852829 RepID=A0A1V5SE31_9BACT|nr:MAG: 30S ribosomal protein S17 [candidate division WS2 bacterium ADurb.Bin280]
MANKNLQGKVLKTFDKTISVEVENIVKHGVYGKMVRKFKKILSHDESGEAKVGDVVVIEGCAPISKRKSFRLKSIITK